MKDNKEMKNTLLLIGIIVSIGFFIIAGFYSNRKSERYIVSVIAGEAHSERWAVLQQGLEKAGNDYNAQINFYTISDSEDGEEQAALIRRELEKQVDALIISAVDSQKITEVLQEKNSNTEILLIEGDLEPGFLYPQIAADNYEMGYQLAEEVIRQTDTGDIRIGIIMETEKTSAQAERLKGLQDAFSEHSDIAVEWVVKNDNRPDEANWYYNTIPVDGIIALDCVSTEEAIEIVGRNDTKAAIYGFGNTESNIYYLDKNIIKALAVPNEYEMGYLSVKNAVQKIERKLTQDFTEVEYLIVNKDTLYQEDNQRIVFPFVQ